jgi:hypothetical protein
MSENKNKYILIINYNNPVSFTSAIYDEDYVVHAPIECDNLLNIIARILGDNDYVLENAFYIIKNDLIYGIKIKYLELDEEQSNQSLDSTIKEVPCTSLIEQSTKIDKYINKFNSKSSNYVVKLIKVNIVKLQIIGWSPSYIRTQTTTCISVPQDIKNMIKEAKKILLNYDIDSELSIRNIKESRDIDPEIILTIVSISQEYKIDIDTISQINSDLEKLSINDITIKFF